MDGYVESINRGRKYAIEKPSNKRLAVAELDSDTCGANRSASGARNCRSPQREFGDCARNIPAPSIELNKLMEKQLPDISNSP